MKNTIQAIKNQKTKCRHCMAFIVGKCQGNPIGACNKFMTAQVWVKLAGRR